MKSIFYYTEVVSFYKVLVNVCQKLGKTAALKIYMKITSGSRAKWRSLLRECTCTNLNNLFCGYFVFPIYTAICFHSYRGMVAIPMEKGKLCHGEKFGENFETVKNFSLDLYLPQWQENVILINNLLIPLKSKFLPQSYK